MDISNQIILKMGFKHKFERIPFFFSEKVSFLKWSLTITCTNWLMGETVDILLVPSDGSQPWRYKNLHFNAGGSYRFDMETERWEWFQGDKAIILGRGDKVIAEFVFRMTEYGPGECPECHGTKICRTCDGRIYDFKPAARSLYLTELTHCPRCNAGKCPTCDIPYRKKKFQQGPTGLKQF